MSVRDLIIVGAGPSGLSAAIAAKKRDLDYQVLEQGVLVNSIHRFPPQMVFFTTPELLEIGGLPFVSPYEKPTRAESLKYYRKVADAYDLQIAFEERVLAVQRAGAGQDRRAGGTGRAGEAEWAGRALESGAAGQAALTGRAGESGLVGGAGLEDSVFEVETRSSRGVVRLRQARFVVFAIGYYDRPNMIHVPGEDLPHVSHYYHEPHRHYRQRVIIVGGGNSAAEAALEVYRAGARVTLVHRWPHLKPSIKYWVRPDIENRIKEGSIAARFGACVKEIRPASVVITPAAGTRGLHTGEGSGSLQPEADEEISADAVYLLTGYRADTELMCRAGVRLTDREGPCYNPETFETNVPNLFVAGGAIAGVDTGTIFIENGRFHGEKIVEVIASRLR
jgi:thioredoxin reductase (NADPH)